MTHAIRLSRLSRLDIAEAWEYAGRHAPNSADRWLGRIQAAIETLAVHPERCPFAREAARVEFPVRELLSGRRPNVYRILFIVDGDDVIVLRVRRAQRRSLSSGEIEESFETESPRQPDE